MNEGGMKGIHPNRGDVVMMRYRRGVLRLALALGFGLAAAGGASSQTGGGGAKDRRLVIDPGTFVEMPAEALSGREASRARGESAPRSARTVGESAGQGVGLPSPSVGPRIALRRPGDESVFREDEPVSVHVEFLPAADGAAPDMETLKVKVRKGWFGKDITDKVEPYVEGAAVRVPEVDFSGHTGDFRFEIRIRDARGRPGEAQFRVRIRS